MSDEDSSFEEMVNKLKNYYLEKIIILKLMI